MAKAAKKSEASAGRSKSFESEGHVDITTMTEVLGELEALKARAAGLKAMMESRAEFTGVMAKKVASRIRAFEAYSTYLNGVEDAVVGKRKR